MMFTSALAMGATLGSFLNPYLFFAIVSVSCGEIFLSTFDGKDADYVSPAVSQLYLGLFWVACSVASFIALAYRQGGLAPPLMDSPAPASRTARKVIKEPPS